MKLLSLFGLLIVVALGAFIWKDQIQQLSNTVNNQLPENIMANVNSAANSLVRSINVPLKKLDLSNRGLSKVPEDTFDQLTVQELDLSGNKLVGAIQAEIRELVNLEILDLSDNQLTGVPAEVGQLSRLRVLDLSNNKLTGLPYELGNLKKLEIFDISGNNYAQADLDIIKKGLPASVKI